MAMLPPMVLDRASAGRWRDTEWLLTNGLGGYALGTALGMPTRRYHALLVTALSPPVGRVVALNSMVASLVLDPGGRDEQRFELSQYTFHDGTEHPRGGQWLTQFALKEAGTLAEWTWQVHGQSDREGGSGWRIVKSLRLEPGVNAAALRYQVMPVDERTHAGKGGARSRGLCLVLRPLVSMRDHHWLLGAGGGAAEEFAFEAEHRRVLIRRGSRGEPANAPGGLKLTLQADRGLFTPEVQWWHRFAYEHERARGLDWQEDLFSPGAFTLDARAGESLDLHLQARVEAPGAPPADVPMNGGKERARVRRAARESAASLAVRDLRGEASDRQRVALLAESSDDFVVRRGTTPQARAGQTSIIAGYPWFSDWGRDSMISLPGLLLATGRLEEAGGVLLAFAQRRRNGLIPNCYDDATGEAQYNTVDASLWFLHAAHAWIHAGGDASAFAAGSELRQAALEILDRYQRGTDFGIAMDPEDGLIAAGDPSTQLTWMDAKRDGVVFTPRHGKAIEINALWQRGLRCVADLVRPDAPAKAKALSELAERVGRGIESKFWDARSQRMADVLTPSGSSTRASAAIVGKVSAWQVDLRCRPNQVFTVSLERSAMPMDIQRSVVAAVEAKLRTPMGLRTLAPDERGYVGRFAGPIFDRDNAYHNGTVWPWLMGPLAEAIMRVEQFSPASRERALEMLRPIADAMLNGSGLGQLAEIYDGDHSPEHPQQPGGCPAQAWSLAETLRVMRLAMIG